MQHGEHYYYYKGMYKQAKYYSCSKSRTALKCKARLICGEDGFFQIKGGHTCVTDDRINSRDVQDEMRQVLELRGLEDLRVVPGRVWRNVRYEMIRLYGESSGIRIITKTEGIGIVKRCRIDANGGDVFLLIETKEVRQVSDEDEREFLLVSLTYPIEGKYQRLVRFGHPDLVRLMKYPGITLFVDAAFSVTPKPFTQTILIMIYDKAHDVYIPCIYLLVDSEDHWSYWNAFQWVKIQTDMACSPSVVVCDFEQALHLGVRDQFESAHVSSIGNKQFAVR
ncbi:hypothetical protein PF008_g17209 [Phytophthora fragariae]|uniref:MULE transposase domain-containing protein n=1 Tax=Phytophthora fragariae TaxID=53985 RepID=A0A6G0R919_9STRA|nr:hypothetical protein PF008_g17209 [Phytophthora fragariae]